MTRSFWLSFVDADREPGDRFLGVCVVDITDEEAAAILPEVRAKFPRALPDAEWLAAAVRKAWDLGVNPGGEIATQELPPNRLFAAMPRDCLLSRADLIAWADDNPVDIT